MEYLLGLLLGFFVAMSLWAACETFLSPPDLDHKPEDIYQITLDLSKEYIHRLLELQEFYKLTGKRAEMVEHLLEAQYEQVRSTQEVLMICAEYNGEHCTDHIGTRQRDTGAHTN